MKLFDYIVGFIFVLIIGLKVYLFPNVINKLNISTGLYTLNIVTYVVLFVSICFIGLKYSYKNIYIALRSSWLYGIILEIPH